MAVSRISISLTPELGDALQGLSRRMRMDRSRLIETLLRESAVVREALRVLRASPAEAGLKKGRSVGKLLLLARASDALWTESIRSGRVKVHGHRL